MNAAKVTAIRETENTIIKFESHIHVDTVFMLVGALQQFFGICKPHKLAIKAKMHRQQAAVHDEEHIFASAIDSPNAAALGSADDMSNGLRLYGDGVKNVNATDSLPHHERPECANDSFYFRQFRHERCIESRTWL
jgi:hypothetical protein